jgi:hypothetical protein
VTNLSLRRYGRVPHRDTRAVAQKVFELAWWEAVNAQRPTQPAARRHVRRLLACPEDTFAPKSSRQLLASALIRSSECAASADPRSDLAVKFSERRPARPAKHEEPPFGSWIDQVGLESPLEALGLRVLVEFRRACVYRVLKGAGAWPSYTSGT